MYKTDNCTLTSILVLLVLNLVIFFTSRVFLINNLLDPIYDSKAKIVSSKRVNIEGHFISHLRSTAHDKCPESYKPLFRNLTTGPTLGYCRQARDASINFKSLRDASQAGLSQSDDSLCPEGYEHVPSTPGLGLYKLETKLICANFINVSKLDYKVSTDGQCPPGMKSCGRLTENFFCLDNEQSCPLNGIRIQNGMTPFSGREKYERLELGNNVFLYFTRQTTDGFLLTDDWTFGSPKGVCLNPDEVASPGETWRFWQKEFLAQCKSVVSGLELDPDYKRMFKMSWKRLLMNNRVNVFAQKHGLDLEGRIGDWEVGIFHKTKIYFNKECANFDQSYDETFTAFGSAVNYESLYVLLMVLVVLNSCVIVTLLVQLVIGYLLKRGRLVPNYTLNWKTLVKSLSLVGLFNILMIMLVIVSLVLIKQNKNHIYAEAKRQGYSCVDSSLARFVDFFLDKDHVISEAMILTLTFAIISIICYIIFFLIIIKNFDVLPDHTHPQSKTWAANSKSAEDIHTTSQTTSSTHSKYSQKSRDETYNQFKHKFMSGDYNSRDNSTWGTFHVSGLNAPAEAKPEEPNLEDYVYIDEQDEQFEDEGASGGGIAELEMGYSQFFKKDENKKSQSWLRSNSLSDISRSQEFKGLANDTPDAFDVSKYSSGENKSGRFGLNRICPELVKKRSGSRSGEFNVHSVESESLTSNNTSINMVNVNFVKNNILNFTKEEIVYRSGSVGEEREPGSGPELNR